VNNPTLMDTTCKALKPKLDSIEREKKSTLEPPPIPARPRTPRQPHSEQQQTTADMSTAVQQPHICAANNDSPMIVFVLQTQRHPHRYREHNPPQRHRILRAVFPQSARVLQRPCDGCPSRKTSSTATHTPSDGAGLPLLLHSFKHKQQRVLSAIRAPVPRQTKAPRQQAKQTPGAYFLPHKGLSHMQA
jgi:hypothetical protein